MLTVNTLFLSITVSLTVTFYTLLFEAVYENCLHSQGGGNVNSSVVSITSLDQIRKPVCDTGFKPQFVSTVALYIVTKFVGNL